MNTTQLTCFVEVAQCLNFARAAEILHMSQPAVSKQVRSLEDELGVKLFIRSTRSVKLTYEGRHFFPDAKGILIQERNAVNGLAELGKTRGKTIVAGTYGMEVFEYLPEVFRKLLENIPEVRPDIVFAPYQSLSNSQKSGAIDIFIGTREFIGAEMKEEGSFVQLAEAPVYKVFSEAVSQENPFSLRLTCAVLETVLRKSVFSVINDTHDIMGDGAGAKSGNSSVHVCDNIETALCLAAAGAGYMLLPVPDRLHRAGLKYIPVPDSPVFSYGYFYTQDNPNPVLTKFRQLLGDYFDGADVRV